MKYIKLNLSFATAAVILSACGSDNNAVTTVDLNFVPQIAGSAFTCQGEYTGMGNGVSQTYRATDFRWYASDFVLMSENGETERMTLIDDDNGLILQDGQHNLALLGQIDGCDGADAQQHLSVSGEASGSGYEQACFTLGVPFAWNHLDVSSIDTPSPLGPDFADMNWNWRGGRKFIKIDGVGELQQDGTGTAFNFHLGSTGCDSESPSTAPTEECTFPNTRQYCFDLAALQAGRTISVDPARLAAETDLGFNTENTAPGCMGFPNDPECVSIMPRHGLDYMLNGELIPAQNPQLFALSAE